MTYVVPATVPQDHIKLATELRTLIPVLKEKEMQALIQYKSTQKAEDLTKWALDRGKPYTPDQLKLVERLIIRAKRKHRKGGPINVSNTVVQNVDVKAVADQVKAMLGKESIDMDVAVAAVIKELDKRQPPKMEIVVKNEATGKTKKVDGPRHAQFPRLLRVAATRMAGGYAPGIFLQGEASSGKTTGSRQVAEALGLKWYFNGAITFPHEMLGFIDGNGKYHTTPFRQAYEHGGTYTFDEVDRSEPTALLAVNPHLANGVATFPDKQVVRHKDCIIICTANTWGLGADANYSGATKLDAAFLSRFPVRINWDIDPVLEDAIVPHPEWLAKVRAARVRAREVGLKVLIDVRAAQAGFTLIQEGFSLQEAAEMTYLANLKSEQRKQLLGIM